MSRKFACILLAVSVLLSSIVIVSAETTSRNIDMYEAAVAALGDAGMTHSSATAFSEGRGMALAAEMGMLSQRGSLSLAQLSAQALLAQEQQQRVAEAAQRNAAIRNAYLSLYSGMLVTAEHTTVYAAPSTDAEPLRSLTGGKVARLLDAADGWYRIDFSGTEGYVPADHCRGVSFSDYAGTLATMDLYEALIDYAYTWLGTPYAWGGSSYSGADCSGFVMAVFGQFGYSLSHSATAQYNRATPVSSAERQAGDLVFFSSYDTAGIDHVGIYLGNGYFIHSSSSRGVIVSHLSDYYWCDHYLFAARLLEE